MTMREITVGDVPVRALRVTFVGELGWELYCPTEYGAGAVAHALGGGARRTASSRAATRRSTRCAWRRATASGRADITPDETPYEAGLGFCVKLDKDGGFIGRDALAGAPRTPRHAQRLVCLVLDDPRSVALGNEPVRLGGEIAGRVTSGGYGYTRRALDRLRVRAGRERRARHRGRDRHLRRVGRRARSRRSRCTTPRASASGPDRVACGARTDTRRRRSYSAAHTRPTV